MMSFKNLISNGHQKAANDAAELEKSGVSHRGVLGLLGELASLDENGLPFDSWDDNDRFPPTGACEACC